MKVRNIVPSPTIWPCRLGVHSWKKLNRHGKYDRIDYIYKDATADCDGWIDPQKWLPIPYDLCFLKTDIRTVKGWWTGKGWDGAYVTHEDNVKLWKKSEEMVG